MYNSKCRTHTYTPTIPRASSLGYHFSYFLIWSLPKNWGGTPKSCKSYYIYNIIDIIYIYIYNNYLDHFNRKSHGDLGIHHFGNPPLTNKRTKTQPWLPSSSGQRRLQVSISFLGLLSKLPCCSAKRFRKILKSLLNWRRFPFLNLFGTNMDKLSSPSAGLRREIETEKRTYSRISRLNTGGCTLL